MTTTSTRSPGCFRAYSNEQKTLRAKLDQLLKWTRDLKSNIMKQSCKALQATATNNNDVKHQTIDQIHDELDDYKRKFDRELGRIHDICDALTDNNTTNGDVENIADEILEALRRSPTYSSLEQHIYDERLPRIRVKPRERMHPGKNRIPRTVGLSTESIKRKASQPIALQVLDTSSSFGTKRRSDIEAFRRSRSFKNTEHRETRLGMDYIEEGQDDLSWKPFGPKRTISQASLASTNNEQSNDEQISIDPTKTNASAPSTAPTEKPKPTVNLDNDSSDEEFDVAWARRMKQKARKEAAQSTTQTREKRTVRFSPSICEQNEPIEINLDESVQDDLFEARDQNNNSDKRQTEIVNLDDEDDDTTTMSATDTQSQIVMTSTVSSQKASNVNDDGQIVLDSDDDEIIALSDDESSRRSNVLSRKTPWSSSEIQITTGGSQPQSLHNPYRVGIADPSLRSLFLPPPLSSNSQPGSNNSNKKGQGGNRKTSPTKRTNNNKHK